MSEHHWLVPQPGSQESSQPDAVSSEQGSDWFIGRGRAMVSLGPLGRQHCPYRCAFCYVQGAFPRYPAASVNRIVERLKEHSQQFSIVYVSGDTDSFAKPRTARGIELLSALLQLGKDVLFTTRAVFNKTERLEIEGIAKQYVARQRLLVGCVSISQLHHPSLEPPPIRSVDERIAQLAWMRSNDIVSILTIRPFIPMIPASEYVEIAERASGCASAIIGGDWYADNGGVVAAKTLSALEGTRLPEPDRFGPLYFSTNPEPAWFTYKHYEAEAALQEYSRRTGVPFFMGSEAAVASIRRQIPTPILPL